MEEMKNVMMMMFVLMVVVFTTGCTSKEVCPVPGCNTTHLLYYNQDMQKVGEKIAKGEANLTLPVWMSKWGLWDAEGVQSHLAHTRYWVEKAKPSHTHYTRQKGWEDKDLVWNDQTVELFLDLTGEWVPPTH